MKATSPETVRQIVADYLRGDSSTAVGRRYNVDPVTVINWVRRSGSEVRKKTHVPETRPRDRVYSLNHRAFAEPTDAACFWAGFLLADGCVHRTPKGYCILVLKLAVADYDHVAAMRDFLGSSHPIRIRGESNNAAINGKVVRSSGSAELYVSSEPILNDLARYGVVPGKTRRCEIPDFLADNPHFWRGVVDGDGTVNFRIGNKLLDGRRARSRPSISLVGSESVVQAFCDFASRRFVSCRGMRPSQYSKIWRAGCSGANAVRLVELLYRNPSPSLARKAEVARQIIKFVPRQPGHRF